METVPTPPPLNGHPPRLHAPHTPLLANDSRRRRPQRLPLLAYELKSRPQPREYERERESEPAAIGSVYAESAAAEGGDAEGGVGEGEEQPAEEGEQFAGRCDGEAREELSGCLMTEDNTSKIPNIYISLSVCVYDQKPKNGYGYLSKQEGKE